MRANRLILGLALAVTLCIAALAAAQTLVPAPTPEPAPKAEPGLVVLWTSGDPDVAHRVCFMYTQAAASNKWFEDVRLVVWGPSARLLAGDKDLQAKIRAMQKAGVKVQACVACARSYGVDDDLRAMGIEVKGMGKPLSDYIKSGRHVLCF